jgi:uncharacterized membrane protein YkgB
MSGRTEQRARPQTGALSVTEARAVALLRCHGPLFMRWALGLVFAWFGALKIADTTPVAELIADTLRLRADPGRRPYPALGLFEIGTFLVLVRQPEVAFQNGNPLLLTTEGEFVVKNLVLFAGAMIVAGALPPRQPRPR